MRDTSDPSAVRASPLITETIHSAGPLGRVTIAALPATIGNGVVNAHLPRDQSVSDAWTNCELGGGVFSADREVAERSAEENCERPHQVVRECALHDGRQAAQPRLISARA